jgi:hypothetical protein
LFSIGRSNIKTIDQEEKTSIVSQRVIGVHMYEHITPILRHLLDYQPKEPRPLFEKLSRKQEVPIDHQIDSYSLAQRRLTLLSVKHPTIDSILIPVFRISSRLTVIRKK